MATLSIQQVSVTGTAPTYSAVNASDSAPPDDHVFLHVKNGGGGACTVTIATPGVGPGGIAVPDVTVSVPAAGDRMIGPLNAQLQDQTTGLVVVSYSPTTSVTAALLRS